MKYHDQVYGEFEIQEPVLLELMHSSALERLKKIYQGGYGYTAAAHQANRYEHSVGVMLLLKKFGARLEEQVAGLIHDVSHSAFSHTIDYALENVSAQIKQSYQDDIFANFVREKTDIPGILKKNGINIDYILADANFPLKETQLPDLCADRIDYVLRDADRLQQQNPIALINDLKVIDNKWVFSNVSAAQKFADFFYKINQVYYSGLSTATMFKSVGEGLKYLIEQKLLTHEDLYTNDEQVINIMKDIAAKDIIFKQHWYKMNHQKQYINDPENYDYVVWVKSRAIDPLCIHSNKVVKLSHCNTNWGKIVTQELLPKQYFLHFVE